MSDLPFYSYRESKISHETRQVLLSDIQFTSMVPEISRSADHLCHAEEDQNPERSEEIMQLSQHEPSVYFCSGYVFENTH